MKTYQRSFVIILGTALLCFPLLFSSCAERDAPEAAVVQKLLDGYYGAQGLKVVSLDLGQIEGAPLAQKTYGKKRAFNVTVKWLMLEGHGRQVARKNGVITIRQKAGAADEWEIERMPPELAP